MQDLAAAFPEALAVGEDPDGAYYVFPEFGVAFPLTTGHDALHLDKGVFLRSQLAPLGCSQPHLTLRPATTPDGAFPWAAFRCEVRMTSAVTTHRLREQASSARLLVSSSTRASDG